MYQHPKDKDLPGFTRDSEGRPKPGYHNPSGVSGLDIDAETGRSYGMADVIGESMFGRDGWEERRKRAERQRRSRSIITWIAGAGCFIISALIATAAVLGLILLVKWLVSLL